MSLRLPILFAAVAAMLLAGCSGGQPATSAGATTGQPPIAEGKGAIAGLLVDDVYRPIPAGLVVVQGTGLVATTDDSGQFTFINLEPGAYLLQVQATGFEMAPKPIEVKAGIYNPVDLIASRLVNQGSQILTAEYSIFMTCSAEGVIVSGNGFNCFFDLSGDSERTGFLTDLTGTANVTYLVEEVKFNNKGDYDFDIAKDNDGDGILDDYWAELTVAQGDYGKIVMKANATNTVAEKGRNLVWQPDKRDFQTTIFPHGAGYGTINPQTQDICYAGCGGAGVVLGVRATIVQSVFIGKPPVDVNSYHVL